MSYFPYFRLCKWGVYLSESPIKSGTRFRLSYHCTTNSITGIGLCPMLTQNSEETYLSKTREWTEVYWRKDPLVSVATSPSPPFRLTTIWSNSSSSSGGLRHPFGLWMFWVCYTVDTCDVWFSGWFGSSRIRTIRYFIRRKHINILHFSRLWITRGTLTPWYL